jgi:hypothetical protein
MDVVGETAEFQDSNLLAGYRQVRRRCDGDLLQSINIFTRRSFSSLCDGFHCHSVGAAVRSFRFSILLLFPPNWRGAPSFTPRLLFFLRQAVSGASHPGTGTGSQT